MLLCNQAFNVSNRNLITYLCIHYMKFDTKLCRGWMCDQYIITTQIIGVIQYLQKQLCQSIPSFMDAIFEYWQGHRYTLKGERIEFTNGYEMLHKAWRDIEEVPYCFCRSYVKFLGHTALRIVEFDPDWAFPDYNSSLNSSMAT